MSTDEQAIQQTKKWITDVVIGCNFCPFAARELKRDTVHYQVENAVELSICLESFLQECFRLDTEKNIETSLLIFPNAFKEFTDFLHVISLAEKLIKKYKYTGMYQVASFHPLYCFANSPAGDAANYTNRSVYPMLHLLREESIEKALLNYANPGKIPENNIRFTHEKGAVYMKMLRDACL